MEAACPGQEGRFRRGETLPAIEKKIRRSILNVSLKMIGSGKIHEREMEGKLGTLINCSLSKTSQETT